MGKRKISMLTLKFLAYGRCIHRIGSGFLGIMRSRYSLYIALQMIIMIFVFAMLIWDLSFVRLYTAMMSLKVYFDKKKSRKACRGCVRHIRTEEERGISLRILDATIYKFSSLLYSEDTGRSHVKKYPLRNDIDTSKKVMYYIKR